MPRSTSVLPSIVDASDKADRLPQAREIFCRIEF